MTLEVNGQGYIDLGSSTELELSSNASFTLEGWTYFRSFDSRDILWSRNDDRSNAPYDYLLGVISTNDSLGAYDGSSWQTVSSPLSINTWYHLAFVFDGTDMFFYVDGDLIGSTSFSWSLDTSNTVKIGGYDAGSDIDGYYSNIRFWSINRTQTEIQNNMYTRLDGTESNLVALYRMDYGSGDTVYDLAGSNNGTINGASWVDNIEFVDGLFSKAIQINTGAIRINNIDLSSSYTICFYRKEIGASTWTQIIYSNTGDYWINGEKNISYNLDWLVPKSDHLVITGSAEQICELVILEDELGINDRSNWIKYQRPFYDTSNNQNITSPTSVSIEEV